MTFQPRQAAMESAERDRDYPYRGVTVPRETARNVPLQRAGLLGPMLGEYKSRHTRLPRLEGMHIYA